MGHTRVAGRGGRSTRGAQYSCQTREIISGGLGDRSGCSVSQGQEIRGAVDRRMWKLALISVFCWSQDVRADIFKETNANALVDQMIGELVEDQKIAVLELADQTIQRKFRIGFIRPRLNLNITDPVVSGLNSLTRSSEAVMEYSEVDGMPNFNVKFNAKVSNVKAKVAAKGVVSNFLHIKNIDFPGVILDILLGSMELGVELVMRITDDLKIISEIKSLHIARLGSIEVGVFGLSRRFARVVNQVLKIGVGYLRRNLGIVIEPLKKILNGLLTKFAPDDLTALL